MKIAILTLPLRTNYGGILQAYALQTVLERQGHEVSVLNLPQNYQLSILKKLLAYPKRMISRYILGRNTIVRWELRMNERNRVSMQYTRNFINKYIHSANIKAFSSLKEKDYDAIVVGSDQIWRPSYYPEIESAFLNFANGWNIKRIAYAPSFGVDNWEYTDEQTEVCRRLISCFDAVSVREESGVALCHRYLGIETEWVLDPTMLLDSKDYIKLFQSEGTPCSKGNLLCYILDDNPRAKTLIEDVAKSLNLKAFRVNSQVENYNASLECCVQPPVESWLRGFYDAQFVVTDSFHACVFSILFKKQFAVIGNAERGLSRVKSLLGMFGLESRFVEERADFQGFDDIDYDKVYYRLKKRKEQSMAFLLNSLCNE